MLVSLPMPSSSIVNISVEWVRLDWLAHDGRRLISTNFCHLQLLSKHLGMNYSLDYNAAGRNNRSCLGAKKAFWQTVCAINELQPTSIVCMAWDAIRCSLLQRHFAGHLLQRQGHGIFSTWRSYSFAMIIKKSTDYRDVSRIVSSQWSLQKRVL